MHRVASSGGRIAVVTATRGEAGAETGTVDPDVLARQREAELRTSLTEVGAHSLRFLGHRDGECDDVPHVQGVAEVRRAIEATRPDVVITFGPDGITGHPDHLAVHRWTTEAWMQTGHGTLLYAVMSRSFLDRYRDLHNQMGVFGDHLPVGHATDELALAIDLDDRELDRKRRALAAHASQTTGLADAMGEATYRSWWAQECFRRPDTADLDAVKSAAVA
jgi:LmbE family N-acetylglucosaminyl deacetylase